MAHRLSSDGQSEMLMYRMFIVATALVSLLCVNIPAAAYDSEYPINAGQGDDLSRNRSFMICVRTEGNAQVKTKVFTPEKVRSDLVGRSVGPELAVKVKTRAAYGDDSGASTGISSAHAYVPIPMDMVFDQTNITNLKIQEAKASGTTATLVVQVETVSNYAGNLRLRYESVAGEWILRELENLSFKAQ